MKRSLRNGTKEHETLHHRVFSMTILENLSQLQEKFHEWDKKQNPERHRLTKDFYSREDMKEMCLYCAEYYKWNDQFYYNIEHATFYRKGKRA